VFFTALFFDMLLLIKKNLKTLAILWSVLIFFLLAFPAGDMEGKFTLSIPGIDKMIHAFIFAVYSRLWFLAINRNKTIQFSHILLIFSSGFLYGWLMECIQLLPVVNRDYEWRDLVADSIGAGFVFFFPRK